MSVSRCLLHTARLKRPISVAPMVDITTPQFLELLHIISGEHRYDYYSEMYHSEAILHHQGHLDRFVGKPRSNVVVQLGGSQPDSMAKAAKVLQENGYSEVNINVGCPSPNVQHGQFGAVLMKTPNKVADILSTMDKYNVHIPVTVKCRIGVDHQDSMEFLENFVSTLMQSSRPPPHLIVHARKCILKGLSPKQNRTIPPLNYERVYELSQLFPHLHLSINGGFTETGSIQQALTKVDGCMIGRKVMDHPLFLQEMDRHLYKDESTKPVSSIIDEYLDYTDKLLSLPLDKEDYGLPPFTLLVKPIMMLYSGRVGRNFRRILTEQLKSKPSPHSFPSLVRNSLIQSQ
ncbi:dihydrouridine synthase-domain-containing protein [Pilobolus umbonatus]|nr:dihydrouridine synthase-domain-containing protein [Pilobolus umbonatus]